MIIIDRSVPFKWNYWFMPSNIIFPETNRNISVEKDETKTELYAQLKEDEEKRKELEKSAEISASTEYYDDVTGKLFKKVITTIKDGKKVTEEYNGEGKLTKKTTENI